MGDDVLFHVEGVRITAKSAEFGSTMYPTANISSVSLLAPQRGGGIMLAIIGAGVIATGFLIETMFIGGIGGLLLLWGAGSAALATWRIRLATSGGEVQAFETRDGDTAAQVSLALKKAITR